MKNLENSISKKRTDPNGRLLSPGITYRDDREIYYVKYKGQDGKWHGRSFKNLKEAEKFNREMKYLKDKNKLPSVSKMTVDQLFELFLKDKVRSHKRGSIASFRSWYKNHIAPAMGSRKVLDVTKRDCQDILNHMHDKHYKRKTIENIRVLLDILFNYASSEDVIDKSPAVELEVPNCDETDEQNEKQYLSAEQFPAFLAAAKPYSVYPALGLLLETGLRIGELMALEWKNIDFEKRTLTVSRALNYNSVLSGDRRYEWFFDSPKTKNGKRTVPLTPRALEILRELRAQYEKEKRIRASMPKAPKTGFEMLIFRTKNDMPVHKTYYNRVIRKIKKKTGLPVSSVHDLRHAYISYMANDRKVDLKYLYKIVGHSSPQTIYTTYFHCTDEQLLEVFFRSYRQN